MVGAAARVSTHPAFLATAPERWAPPLPGQKFVFALPLPLPLLPRRPLPLPLPLSLPPLPLPPLSLPPLPLALPSRSTTASPGLGTRTIPWGCFLASPLAVGVAPSPSASLPVAEALGAVIHSRGRKGLAGAYWCSSAAGAILTRVAPGVGDRPRGGLPPPLPPGAAGLCDLEGPRPLSGDRLGLALGDLERPWRPGDAEGLPGERRPAEGVGVTARPLAGDGLTPSP